MADATSFMPPSPGLSATLLSNKCWVLQSQRTRKCKYNNTMLTDYLIEDVIFGIMVHCDIKIGLIKCMWVSDLYFMVQWLSYICKTILWMHVILWIIVQYNTKIDITCSWYFDGYVLAEHHIWDNGSVWHKGWPHKVYLGQWPIFSGTVILPYVLTVNCKLHVFW